MKRIPVFTFVIKYLGWLKPVPLLAHLFDSWLRLISLIMQPQLLQWIDEVEAEVLQWQHTTSTLHKYGGIQLNAAEIELGHIHGNGLVDMLLSRQTKKAIMQEGRISNHHTFKDTGWISLYLKDKEDVAYVTHLFYTAYTNRIKTHISTQNTSSY